jgi:4-amino-4-deoxy-L-arabinose transferase-like glycosyltransferase
MRIIPYQSWIKYFILIILVSIPLFISLSVLPVQLWDEARTGVNAFEMIKNGNLLATYYDGAPDMWHTKPPFVVWCIAVSMRIFDDTLLALRFPSALAGFLTCLLLLLFSVKYLKNFWIGFFTCLILVTSNGYVHLHGTRTGDMDSILTLFLTAYAICFFAFVETQNSRYLLWTFVLITLACYTKGIAGLFFIPALFIYAVIQQKIISVLKNKNFYYGLVLFLVLVPGYYLLREHDMPGFLKTVWENELGGRFASVNEGHGASNWFYFNNMVTRRLSFWYLLVPCGMLAGIFNRKELIKKISLFATVLVLSFLLVISLAQTKLEWYDLPMYPFLAILIGVFVHHVYSVLSAQSLFTTGIPSGIFLIIFSFLLFITPYSAMIKKNYQPVETWQDEDYTQIVYFMKDALKGKYDLEGYRIVSGNLTQHLLFYCYSLNAKGKKISLADIDRLNENEKVIAYQIRTKDFITQNYLTESLGSSNDIAMYKILGRK